VPHVKNGNVLAKNIIIFRQFALFLPLLPIKFLPQVFFSSLFAVLPLLSSIMT
jgi:hypothetical protein